MCRVWEQGESMKIETMHNLYGHYDDKCKNCMHLIKEHGYNKNYYKCEVYGISNSEATDWRLKYDACGLFNKETPHRNLYKVIKPMKVQVVLDGQMEMQGIAERGKEE